MPDTTGMSREDIRALIAELETAAEGVPGLAGSELATRLFDLKSRLIAMDYEIPAIKPTDSSELRRLIEEARQAEANAGERAGLLNQLLDLLVARI
ncbi:hypothetical protein [Maricaulis sp.]|uniref:hypothetical protein n=1 Tax=Maricaulis sp. TaxID=1486257 RepID=UPI00263A2C34|nr:hypothetical protein [Maricaulis sp.]